MFESVLLPAPFSPSSACTSPTAASKSTASFASTPGKRLVMPRIATAGAELAPAATTAPDSLIALRCLASDQDLADPMTPCTSQSIEYSCCTVSFLPAGTTTLPAWFLSGPVNS